MTAVSDAATATPDEIPTSLRLNIRTATRTLHTSLNRLITSRLALCLPPYAPDASSYGYGIAAFADIYIAFEREWKAVISPATTSKGRPPATSSRISALLRNLYTSDLVRSGRIQHDLLLLSGLPASHGRDQIPAFPTNQLIASRVQSRPHVLLAYTWIMYQALFNGGRWIRSQLLSSSSPGFWPIDQRREECLTFWHFDGDQDGDDVKDAFQARFDTAAAQLSEQEIQDVVDEAVAIFKMCADLVEHLDQALPATGISNKGDHHQQRHAHATISTDSSDLLPNADVPSGLTHQLNSILDWVWALVPGTPVMAMPQRPSPASPGVTAGDEARIR